MRLCLLTTSVLVLGCTSTRTVKLAQLAPLSRGGFHDGLAVATTEEWRSRIDPNALVSFARADGARTEPHRAGALQVNARGVFVDTHVPAAPWIDRVRVSALDDIGWRALAGTRPAEGTLVMLGGRNAELRGPGDALVPWIETALVQLRRNGSRELGGWRLHVRRDGWRQPVGGSELHQLFEQGIRLHAGWPWRDIASAQVNDVSGGKTLGVIVGVTAAAAVLVPLALLIRAPGSLRGAMGGDGGDGGGGTGGSGSGGGSGGGDGAGAAALSLTAHGIASAGEPAHDDDALWQPPLAALDARGAVALFDHGARRRAIVRVLAIADAATDLRRPDSLVDGVTVGLRLMDLVEIGGGARHLLVSLPGGGVHQSGLGFFRLGLHLPLDAAHRFAIPLGFDAGGGADATFFRLHGGLRMRVSRDWFAGAFLFNPTRVRYHGDAPDVDHPRWSFSSGLELGAAF